MLPDDRLDQLRRLFEETPRVLAVFVFGSQIDGYATPLLLRRRALQGELLFERDPIAVANLIEDTLRRYRDFAPRLREGRAAYFGEEET